MVSRARVVVVVVIVFFSDFFSSLILESDLRLSILIGALCKSMLMFLVLEAL
jgi:hypothetical protein